MGHCLLAEKKSPQTGKNKISYLQPFKEIIGGQENRKCSAKNGAAGRKNDFFQNFLYCRTSTHRDETFLYLSKFHIFSRSEKSWGGDKIALRQRQQRTTTTNNEHHGRS